MSHSADSAPPVAIALHAGAGTIDRNSLDSEAEREIRATLEQALQAGHDILSSGGSSLDAVTKAVDPVLSPLRLLMFSRRDPWLPLRRTFWSNWFP